MGLRAKYTEAAFTRDVLTLARRLGWRTAHFRPARTADGGWRTAVQGDGKGFLDLLLLRDGALIVAELKVGKGKLTPEQAAWVAAWEAAGVAVYLWRPADWVEIEAVLTEGAGVMVAKGVTT